MSLNCKVDLIYEDGLERRYKFSVNSNDRDGFVDLILEQEQVHFTADGFRKGKVPISVMKEKLLGDGDSNKKFKENIDQKIIDDTFWGFINDNKIDIVGGSTNITSYDNDSEGVRYEVGFEVKPDIAGLVLEDNSIETYKVECTEDDINECRDEMRKSRCFEAPVDHEVLDGDDVIMDFVGKVDGEEFEGGTAKDFSLKIGSGAVIPGIEDKLIGMKVGEQRTVKTSFPENYHAINLAGKDVEFDVDMKSIKTPIANMEEYISKYYAEGGEEEFKKVVSESLDSRSKQMIELLEKKNLFDYLASIEMEHLPKSLVQSNKMSLNNSYAGDELNDMAVRNVKCGLVLDKYVKELSVTADEQEIVSAMIQKFNSLDVGLQGRISQDKNMIDSLRMEAKEELLGAKTARAMIAKMKHEEVVLSFRDLKDKLKNM